MMADGTWMTVLAACVLVWLAWAGVCALLERRRDSGPTDEHRLASLVALVYARLVFRVRVEGFEHARAAVADMHRTGRGLLIVSNHVSGADPVIIESALGQRVRWMMMRSMMLPWLSGLWAFLEVIPVGEGEGNAARAAVRAIEEGSAVGIFAEGVITPRSGRIGAFQPGVGLIVSRSGAPVLQVVMDLEPRTRGAFKSLFRPARGFVRFLPVIDPAGSGVKAGAIARELEQRAAGALGWRVDAGEAASEGRGG